jgi:Spy/CpxP family protein refolding chaperone
MNALLKWKVALYLTAIFAVGSITGWMAGTKTTKQKMLSPPPPEEIGSRIRQDIHKELNLSPEQKAKVDAILEQNSKEMKSLFDAHFQRVRAVASNRNAQITSVLTPEQKVKFEELEKKRHEPRPQNRHRNWQHRPEGGRPPGPPGGPPPRRDGPQTNCKLSPAGAPAPQQCAKLD